MRALSYALIAAFVLSEACHHQAGTGGGGDGLRNVITREQIEASTAANVYDLIVRLRADFLRDRGMVSIRTNQHARAVVFFNGQEYGIPETLRNIPPNRIGEIRFFPGTEAVTRFGAQYGGGVIQLVSRVE